MPPGQPQAEPGAAGNQLGQAATTAQQVIQELDPLGFLPPGDRQVRPLKALRGGGHGIIRRAQDGQPRLPQRGRCAGAAGRPQSRAVIAGRQFPPQSPGGRQVQVDQAAQGDPVLRRLLA